MRVDKDNFTYYQLVQSNGIEVAIITSSSMHADPKNHTNCAVTPSTERVVNSIGNPQKICVRKCLGRLITQSL